MHIYIHIDTHIYIYIHTHAYIPTYIHAYICTHTPAYKYISLVPRLTGMDRNMGVGVKKTSHKAFIYFTDIVADIRYISCGSFWTGTKL